MPRVSPFEGLVFDPAVTGPLDRVTAPPYDVISEARRRDYLDVSPYNIVHLDLAEGSQDPSNPDSRYARAAELLEDWERRGALTRSPEALYYAYEMAFTLEGVARTIRGLFVAMELQAWGGGVIPHERTMPGPVQDRLRLLQAIRTHLSAVYGTVAGPCPGLADLLAEVTGSPAPFDTVDEQGVRHRMWPVPGHHEIGAWLAPEPLLIADGHHRYTTALHYRHERHAVEGPGPWDSVLTLVVDAAAEHLPVLPFHRVQLSGPAPDFGHVVPDLETALAALSDEDVVVATVTREDGAMTYRTATLCGDAPTVRALHADYLDHRVPEGSLRYVHDAEAADAAVAGGEAVAAYLLPPTTQERIRKVIERGERLPQKSTYFWPKPRTGMVMMPLESRP